MIVLSIEHTFFFSLVFISLAVLSFSIAVLKSSFVLISPAWRFSLSTSPTISYTSFKSQIKLITSWRFEIKDFAEREKLSHFWTGDHIQCGSLTAYANNIYSMNLKWLRWERKKVLKSVPERLMKPDFVDANFFRLGFCPASAIIANQTFYYRLQQ